MVTEHWQLSRTMWNCKCKVFQPILFGRYDALLFSALIGLVTLIFWPWNWCTLLPVGWATFLPILVFLWLFVLDLWANTCQMHHVTSQPWPLDLGGHGAWYGSSCSVCIPSFKFVVLLFRRYCAFTVWGLILWPLTFSPLNKFTDDSCDGLPSCKFWAL